MTLQEWANAALAHQFGNYIDVDGYYQGQCWDLAAHYARNVVGCPSLPTGSGGAEGVYRLFQNPIPQYFTKVANNPNDPNQLPPAGALIVYGPTNGNPYGHIEVVMGANSSGVDVVYQDGFNPTQGPLRKFRKWGTLPTMGWLVPKASAKPELQGFQRVVGSAGVYRRPQPNTNLPQTEEFEAGTVLDFAGWVYGQTVSNNNVWFKGRYSDTYFWSGAFKDTGTHDLADLNPKQPPATPSLNPNQRTVADGGLNVRSEPTTMGNIVKTLAPGTVVAGLGFKDGATVEGNKVWIRIQDGWVWSGGFTDQSTHDIPDENPTPAPGQVPTTPPAPVYPAPSTDSSVLAVFNKKHPLPAGYEPADLVSIGGQKLRKEAAEALQLMINAAGDAGVVLTPGSGYRSFATQTTVYNNYVKQDGQEKADTYSARPGYSEHQTGLTMDFTPIDDSFAGTKSDVWLRANACKYGFILRYPADKTDVTGYQFEPWHYRYIGVTVASDMSTKGKTTLEEYYGVAGGKYPEQETPTPTPGDDPKPGDDNVPPEPGKPVEEPHPPLFNDVQTSVIRTTVPYIVGFVVSILAARNITASPEFLANLTAVLTFVVGSVYYVVVRWLETRIPQVGVLLGKAKPPVYADKDKQ